MAYVKRWGYSFPDAQKGNLEELVARTSTVQRNLERLRSNIADDARAILAGHRDEGHAKIVESSGRIDHYVGLDDSVPGESWAPIVIEFGRGEYTVQKDGKTWTVGGMEGIAPLRNAARSAGRRFRPRKYK